MSTAHVPESDHLDGDTMTMLSWLCVVAMTAFGITLGFVAGWWIVEGAFWLATGLV